MIKRICQVLPSYSKRDAVGTDTFLMSAVLNELGIESDIYYELSGDAGSRPLTEMTPYIDRTDTAILLHFSIGSDFPGQFSRFQNRKIVRYHNITPAEFFCSPDESHIRNACNRGRQQIPMLSVFSDLVIGDSAYNCVEFSQYSSIPTAVVPIFRDYQQLRRLNPSPDLVQSLKNAGKPILLFVGRICPNKAQHDLLKLMALYKATYDQPLGLVLVGGFFSPAFKAEIENYARYLGLKTTDDVKRLAENDVVLSGSISDEDMACLYTHSTLFCSLSDHEGFGVPLVESMNFGLPILAHAAAAVPETVGSGGVLVDKNDWRSLVVVIHKLVHSDDWRRELKEQGRKRAYDLSLEKTSQILAKVLVDYAFL